MQLAHIKNKSVDLYKFFWKKIAVRQKTYTLKPFLHQFQTKKDNFSHSSQTKA